MIFVVKSAAGNFQAREILRRTWAGVSYLEGFQFASIYVIGKTTKKTQALVDEEYARYGDILQVNMTDEYRYRTHAKNNAKKLVIKNKPYFFCCALIEAFVFEKTKIWFRGLTKELVSSNYNFCLKLSN